MKKIKLSVLAISLMLCSCATITNGSRQKVLIKSNPEGASVYIDDKLYGETPVLIDIKRSTKEIEFKKEGYSNFVHKCIRKTSGKYIANMLYLPLGFIAVPLYVLPVNFMLIDIATGSCYVQNDEINVELIKN